MRVVKDVTAKKKLREANENGYEYEVYVSMPCDVTVKVHSASPLTDSEIEDLVNDNIFSESYTHGRAGVDFYDDPDDVEFEVMDVDISTDWVKIEYVD